MLFENAFVASARKLSLDEIIIQACVNELAIARVKDGDTTMINLGQPDPTLLPLATTNAPKPTTERR